VASGGGAALTRPVIVVPRPVPPRTAGVRCSVADVVVLALALALAWWLRAIGQPLWWVVPMTVGHFFLFCNVFMVWQTWELAWAGTFVVNVLAHLLTGNSGWWPACAWQMLATVLAIGLQLRSPWYHGIGATHVNPRLGDYLEHRI